MRILWTNHAGQLCVTTPVLDGRRTLEQIIAKAVPPDREITLVEAATIPADRTFRDAWKMDNGALAVDMPRARNIHRDRIRAARAPILAALDAEYMRADERGDTVAKAEIAAQKQALRDAPNDPAIEAAATPEELKAVWPLPAEGAKP